MMKLEDKAYFLVSECRQLFAAKPQDINTVYLQRAGIRSRQDPQNLKQCGFSGTGCTHNRHNLRLFRTKVNTFQHPQRPKRLFYIFSFYYHIKSENNSHIKLIYDTAVKYKQKNGFVNIPCCFSGSLKRPVNSVVIFNQYASNFLSIPYFVRGIPVLLAMHLLIFCAKSSVKLPSRLVVQFHQNPFDRFGVFLFLGICHCFSNAKEI